MSVEVSQLPQTSQCSSCRRWRMANKFTHRKSTCDDCYLTNQERKFARQKKEQEKAPHMVKCESCDRWLDATHEPWCAAKCQRCWPATAAPKWLETWKAQRRA